MSQHPPSWAAINGYGVLVGLLELFICLFFILDPPDGFQPLTWTAHIGIGIAGAGLLYSYVRARIDVEVYASVVLVVANLLQFLVEVRWSTTATFDVRSATLQLIILAAVSLRISALLRGGTIAIPRWER